MDEYGLADLERRTRDSAAGDLRAALVALEREVTVIYTAVAGDPLHALPELAQQTIRKRLVEALHGLATYDYADTRKVLTRAARTAMAGGAADVGVPVSDTLPADIRQAMTALTGNMRKDLHDALKLARYGPMKRLGDARTVVGMARKALNHADSTAVWLVHRAHNEGRSRAIDKAFSGGVQVAKLWRAERGACVACLGYAGALAEPGESFRPVVDVADPSQRPDGPVWGPPLHPHCRCALEWWTGPGEADLTAVDLPVALRREAQRSIASGAAMGSEPNRLRAAERLLDVAELLIPKTAQRRARKALQAGQFPD